MDRILLNLYDSFVWGNEGKQKNNVNTFWVNYFFKKLIFICNALSNYAAHKRLKFLHESKIMNSLSLSTLPAWISTEYHHFYSFRHYYHVRSLAYEVTEYLSSLASLACIMRGIVSLINCSDIWLPFLVFAWFHRRDIFRVIFFKHRQTCKNGVLIAK